MNYAVRYANLWRLYLAACIAAAAANLLHAVFGGADLTPVRLLAVAFGCIAPLPLAGYVRQRALAPKALWTAVHFIAIFAVAALVAVAIAHALPRTLLALQLFLLAAFACPYLFAMQQYLHHSPHLWRPHDAG
jgi:hypothetical protein